MGKLSADQKSIIGLFQDRNIDFLIPDYQRPYSWSDNFGCIQNENQEFNTVDYRLDIEHICKK